MVLPMSSTNSSSSPTTMARRRRRRRRLFSTRRLIASLIFLTTVALGVHMFLLLSHMPIEQQGEREPHVAAPMTTSGATKKNTTTPSLDDYAIPRILIFTHYRDLLQEEAKLTDSEEIVLAANIRNVIALHDNTLTKNNPLQVRFLTDEQCIESLQRTYPALISHFQKETQGMYKADICRGSALYETGGFYLDVDVGVRSDLWKDLLPTTAFVTARVHAQSNYPGHFFQAILGAAPASPILHKYLELFEDHYTGRERVEKGPLGVILLRRAWERVYDETSRSPLTELYQEVLYDRRLFPHLHPAPTWGTRRACHFVVVATANQPQNVELTWKDRDYRIPFYSRIAGSRMCPISKEEHQEQQPAKEKVQ